MMQKLLISILLFALIATGCSSSGGVSTPTAGAPELAPAPSETAEGYPAPDTRLYVPPTPQTYPGAEGQPTEAPFVVPTLGVTGAVVTGQLINVNTGEPLAFHTVYLGQKIPFKTGEGYTYGLQEKSSPHTYTNSEGRFAIGEVPAGEYILILYTPHSISVVHNPEPDDSKELDVIVKTGVVLDLGMMKAVSPAE